MSEETSLPMKEHRNEQPYNLECLDPLFSLAARRRGDADKESFHSRFNHHRCVQVSLNRALA